MGKRDKALRAGILLEYRHGHGQLPSLVPDLSLDCIRRVMVSSLGLSDIPRLVPARHRRYGAFTDRGIELLTGASADATQSRL